MATRPERGTPSASGARRYDVPRRPALIAGTMLLSVALLAVFIVFTAVSAADPNASPAKVIAKVAGLALVFVVLGGVLLVKALRAGPGAYVEVNDDGLVHHARGRCRSWPWSQVRYLEVRGVLGPANRISQLLGSDYRCVIWLDDGTRLQFDRNTTRMQELENEVRRHCPTAPQPPVTAQPWYRFGTGWLLVGLPLLAAFIAVITYLNVTPDYIDVPLPGGSTTEQPAISDGEYGLISISLVILGVATVTCLRTYLLYLSTARKAS